MYMLPKCPISAELRYGIPPHCAARVRRLLLIAYVPCCVMGAEETNAIYQERGETEPTKRWRGATLDELA
eukprot:9503987-Pyramimonas_sp.AAC.2